MYLRRYQLFCSILFSQYKVKRKKCMRAYTKWEAFMHLIRYWHFNFFYIFRRQRISVITILNDSKIKSTSKISRCIIHRLSCKSAMFNRKNNRSVKRKMRCLRKERALHYTPEFAGNNIKLYICYYSKFYKYILVQHIF